MNRTVIPGTALVFILLVFIPWAKAYDLSDKAQIHGFLTQNAIHTTANQAYGKSENSMLKGG